MRVDVQRGLSSLNESLIINEVLLVLYPREKQSSVPLTMAHWQYRESHEKNEGMSYYYFTCVELAVPKKKSSTVPIDCCSTGIGLVRLGAYIFQSLNLSPTEIPKL